MVRRAIDVPVALVTIIEPARQVFIGAEGLQEPWQSRRETPLSHSFCQYVVKDATALIVNDARRDPVVRDNLAIQDLGVVAYAGYPISDASGTVIGSLCAIDGAPRQWRADELAALEDIAATCSTEMTLRQLRAESDRTGKVLLTTAVRLQTILALSNSLVTATTVDEVVSTVQDAAMRHLGCAAASVWLVEDNHLVLYGRPALAWPLGYSRQVALDPGTPLGEATRTGRILVYRDQEAQDAAFPALAGQTSPASDAKARTFVPLRLHGRLLGCLVLVWAQAHRFDDETVDMLSGMAAYTAQAIDRVRLLDERTTVAHTLQRALLTSLPEPKSLQLAARYRAAAEHDEVGGDWYDAIIAPNGATLLVIGDVIGHDVRAAGMMGQLRNLLRALSWQNADDPPSANLCRLDRAMRDLDVRTVATLVCARVEQTDDQRASGEHTLRWTNAGHPPPLLLDRDGTVRVLATEPADPLLGAFPDRPRRDAVTSVPASSTLLLYTDGLVEDAETDIRDGIERLCAALTEHASLPLEQMLDAVIDSVVGTRHDDDIAVLAVRFDPSLAG
jgi:GAF domain-containing protein